MREKKIQQVALLRSMRQIRMSLATHLNSSTVMCYLLISPSDPSTFHCNIGVRTCTLAFLFHTCDSPFLSVEVVPFSISIFPVFVRCLARPSSPSSCTA